MVSVTARAILVIAVSAIAQPRFEVASIKPSSSAELDAIKLSGRSGLFPEQGISVTGNRVTVLGLTPYTLIRAAFSLRAPQLSSTPTWTANESYDISAQAENPLTFAQARQMLQTLLTDRFQLAFHYEIKEGSAYTLAVGKTGHKLTESLALEYSTHVTSGSSQIHMRIACTTIPQLCARLSTFMDRPIVDQTNLKGVFDLTLDFAPEGVDSTEFPSIFTALQEQLGLKLESAKAPIKVLVVDRMERPSAN
jgi:uncharacterized protein (TIGR03435 family)